MAPSPERAARILQHFGNLKAYCYQNPTDAFERDEIDKLTDDLTISQLAGIPCEFYLTASSRLEADTPKRGSSKYGEACSAVLNGNKLRHCWSSSSGCRTRSRSRLAQGSCHRSEKSSFSCRPAPLSGYHTHCSTLRRHPVLSEHEYSVFSASVGDLQGRLRIIV